ncbi:hypothetical protein ACOMHN_048516 [Nucella lapillus]
MNVHGFQFMEECMKVAVKMFLPPYGFQARVGALYLLYGLYLTQPCLPKVKIRVTREDWEHVKSLEDEFKRQSHHDTNFILQKLLLDGAFYFCAVAQEARSRYSQSEETNKSMAESLREDRQRIDSLFSDEILEQLGMIHGRYHKQKVRVAGPDASRPDRSLDVLHDKFPTSVGDVMQQHHERWKAKESQRARWKSSKEEEQIGDVQEAEHVVFVQGNAVSNSKLQAGQDAENGQNEQCAAMRKIDLMNDFIDAADDTNNDMERCFMEFGCLKALLSVVTCQCGGNLHIQFGDKMGYSRQLKLACQDCTFVHQQFSCARVGGTTDVTAAFEVNNCITMCFNELGCGEAALRKFSGIMGIPGFAHNTYRRLSKKQGVRGRSLPTIAESEESEEGESDPDYQPATTVGQRRARLKAMAYRGVKNKQRYKHRVLATESSSSEKGSPPKKKRGRPRATTNKSSIQPAPMTTIREEEDAAATESNALFSMPQFEEPPTEDKKPGRKRKNSVKGGSSSTPAKKQIVEKNTDTTGDREEQSEDVMSPTKRRRGRPSKPKAGSSRQRRPVGRPPKEQAGEASEPKKPENIEEEKKTKKKSEDGEAEKRKAKVGDLEIGGREESSVVEVSPPTSAELSPSSSSEAVGTTSAEPQQSTSGETLEQLPTIKAPHSGKDKATRGRKRTGSGGDRGKGAMIKVAPLPVSAVDKGKKKP